MCTIETVTMDPELSPISNLSLLFMEMLNDSDTPREYQRALASFPHGLQQLLVKGDTQQLVKECQKMMKRMMDDRRLKKAHHERLHAIHAQFQ